MSRGAACTRDRITTNFPTMFLLRWCLVPLLWLTAIRAAEVTATPEFSAHVDRMYRTAREAWKASPTNVQLAWEFGRACFDRADIARSDKMRAALAEEGIEACREGIRISATSGPARYYLGLCLGQLAQTKMLGALKLVRQMEDTWLNARTLDDTFDFAGADRSLGLLYLECPGWPTSVGSKSKARASLERAVKLAPQHPENRLFLIRALVQWREREAARNELRKLLEILPEARARLTGVAWSHGWAAWDREIDALKKKLGVTAAS
jgi:tetratricopeptide (TPR) repeat protein